MPSFKQFALIQANILLAVLIIAGSLFGYRQAFPGASPDVPTPAPTPAVRVDLSFLEAEDASRLAALFEAAADVVEVDGTRAEPRFTQRGQILAYFNALGHFASGGSLSAKYPALPAAFQQALEVFGDQAGPLTPADRERAEGILRSLAASAEDAS